ncbi:discoidin domain-containing protein [Streptacidiphilus sp. PAMC 29251]
MADQHDDAGEADTVRIPLPGETALVRPYVNQAVAEPTEELGSVLEPGPFGRGADRPTMAWPARAQPLDRDPRLVGGARRTAARRPHRHRTALLIGVGAAALAGIGFAVAGAAHLLSGGADAPSGQNAPMLSGPLASASGGAVPAKPSTGSGSPDPSLRSGPARTSGASAPASTAPSATEGSAPATHANGTETGGPGPTVGPNAILRVASASDSGHTQSYTAGNAVDGDPDSYWESTDNAFPQSLTVDLGADRSVGRLVLRLPPLSSWGARTQTLAVLGSTTGTAFTGLTGPAGYTFDPGTGNTVTVLLPAHPSVRYLRLTFTGNSGWPAGQLSDFQAYSS